MLKFEFNFKESQPYKKMIVHVESEDEDQMLKVYNDFIKDNDVNYDFIKGDRQFLKDWRKLLHLCNNMANRGCKVWILIKNYNKFEELGTRLIFKLYRKYNHMDKGIIIKVDKKK